MEPIGRFLRSRHLVDEASGRLISLPFGPRGYTRPFGTRILHMDGEPESEAVTLRRRLLDQVPWPTHHLERAPGA